MLSQVPIENLLVCFSILGGILIVVIGLLIIYVRMGPNVVKPSDPPQLHQDTNLVNRGTIYDPNQISSLRDRLQTEEAKKKYDELSRTNEENESA